MKSHLFAHCSAAVCVAEDTNVSFYAAKSLRKFRSESFSDRRVVGLTITANGPDAILHVVDAAGVYTTVDMSNFAVRSTNSLCLPSDAPARPRARRPAAAPVSGGNVIEAHFYTAPCSTSDGLVAQGALRCVVLTQTTLIDVDPNALDAGSAVPLQCPVPANPLVAVGALSGIVAVSATGSAAVSVVSFSGKRSVCRRTLGKLLVTSLAVSPVESAVAVGGSRGELAVFPSVDSPHCFSDHWHHTSVTALAFSADARALFSGAGESVLLQWSMRDFSFRKIGISLGPIKAVISSATHPHLLLLPCADSSLAMVDTLQASVVASCEGVAWSSGECTGLLAATWMGQPAVVLTGMPECVKICDPLTRQALYSLHVTHQMETVTALPRCGITSVALLDEGKTIVTYEQFHNRALPATLRFWSRPPTATALSHTETQKIHTPHDDAVIALLADVHNGRLFSLSSSTVKCWERSVPAAETADNPVWSCSSFSATPSRNVSAMALSADGSALFVCDDVVHVYSVSSVKPGIAWDRIVVLSQSITSSRLLSLVLLESARAVAAMWAEGVFIWQLQSLACSHMTFSAPPTSICDLSPSSLVVGLSSREVVEVHAAGNIVSKRPAHGVPRFMTRVGLGSACVAMLDESNSLRVMSMPPQKATTEVLGLAAAAGTPLPAQAVPALSTYFRPLEVPETDAADEADSLRSAAAADKSKRWLGQVLGGESYAAPSMATVLASFLTAAN